MIQLDVQRLQVINLSERWVRFIQFVQQHPFVTFEKLRFDNGEPNWFTHDIKGEVPDLDTASVEEHIKL